MNTQLTQMHVTRESVPEDLSVHSQAKLNTVARQLN